MDYRRLARDLQLTDKTVKGYVELLSTIFLVHVAPAWRPGLRSRVMGKLRDSRPHLFKTGVIIYTGSRTVPLGDRLWAVPVSGLWG